MATTRADYASTRERSCGAIVERVEEGSPAWEVGIGPGMRIDRVNGVPLVDLIAWRWEADGSWCELLVTEDPKDPSCEPVEVELWREPGQDWGIEFTDVIFDGIRTCVNACKFCFMAMLPEDARDSLSLRDDDYRLSFLQGNFVTLTNVTDDDVRRIIECRLEPVNVSLHAVSPDVRRHLIGRHAQRGIDVLERLLAEGIEVHGQVVLCPGINDGPELERTLEWVESRPGITSLALVPVGYTKFSRTMTRSFWGDPVAARAVVDLLVPYQERSRERDGITRFQLSDEFYVAAQMEVPHAESYDGYPQFYDGIGMLRSFLDEADEVLRMRGMELCAVAQSLVRDGRHALVVCGEAAESTIASFLSRWSCLASLDGVPSGQSVAHVSSGQVIRHIPHVSNDLSTRHMRHALPARHELTPDVISAFAIKNEYFGGDVNVTGLIVACDLLAQLPDDLDGTIVLLPEVMFNFDGITLDGVSRQDIMLELRGRGAQAAVCMPSPGAMLDALLSL